MGKYVDGFVIPIAKKKVKAYQAIAKKAAKVWMDHGALEYRECIGQDIDGDFGLPFPRLAKTKPGETVIFSWIVYKSKSHRDKVCAKVMQDPRILKVKPEDMPFDSKRMSYGGFDVIVDVLK